MGQLRVDEWYLGKIDGYNEFLEYGPDICTGLFYEFPNVNMEKLMDGSTYYIRGNKGTGKTMLLKYLEAKISAIPTNRTVFIRFKKDVNEEERNQLKRSSLPTNSFEEIIEKDIPNDNTIDSVIAWEVYLIKVIVNRLNKDKYGVFERNDDNWKKLEKLLNALYGESAFSKIQTILPKVKKGAVEINVKDIAKLNLEFEWVDESNHRVKFSSLANTIIDLFSNLKPESDHKVYIMIDELELSLKKNKSFERDITLIRDLIRAIQYLSEVSKVHKYNVYLLCALRNEVYRHVVSKGYELNKPINDFGVEILWQQKGGDIKKHPLLGMLEKRIHYSEKEKGLNLTPDIWEEYFSATINNERIPTTTYILNQTWFKPRDIIRMFRLIQNLKGNKKIIDQEVFDAINGEYAKESWTEFEEELMAVYSDKEVEGIRQVLIGIHIPFVFGDFKERINQKSEFYEEVELLKQNRKPADILKMLYNLGVIGNYSEASRFDFKREYDIDLTQPLTVHYPLRKYFRTIKGYIHN